MDVFGIQIPYKALTNFELEDYAKQLNLNLRGVFMRNNLILFQNTILNFVNLSYICEVKVNPILWQGANPCLDQTLLALFNALNVY